MIQDTRLRELAWKRAGELGKLRDCPPVEKLVAMRAGKLSEQEREGLEQHLTSCPACVDVLVVPTVPDQVVSSGQLRHILRSVGAQEQAEGSLGAWLLSWRSWGVGVLVAAVVVLTLFRPGPEPVAQPAYELSLSGGVQGLRGSEQALQPAQELWSSSARLPEYVPSSVVVLHLTPPLLQEQPVDASSPQVIFYEQEGSSGWRRLSAVPLVEWERQTGVIRVEVEAVKLLGTRLGEHTLKVRVLPEGVDAPDLLEQVETLPTLRLRYRQP